jgi:hypothetical protein
MGGSAIPEKWRVDEEGLWKSGFDRIWVIDIPYAPDGSGRPSLPNEWKPVQETHQSFPEVYSFLGTVSASAYERRQSPGVSAIK